jgi:hypothetical protein
VSNYIAQEKFEDTRGVIRIRKSKDRQHNGPKKKDKRTMMKHYTENSTLSNTNWGLNQVLQKGRQLFLH